MKRLIIYLLIISVLLCSCSIKEEYDPKLDIVTTIFPLYDFTREIVGDNANLDMLIPIGSELHSYEPTPKDMMKIKNADVFIYLGGESDKWVLDILNSLNDEDLKTVAILNEKEKYLDEHIWTSPKNVEFIVNDLYEAISLSDENNKDIYKSNADNYIQKINSLDNKFEDLIKNSDRKTIVFADRYPIICFSDRYNLTYYSPYAGCEHETEASASSVKKIIDIVNEEKIPVVFHLELSNENLANTVCEETGAKKLKFNSCHNVTTEEFEQGITYIDLMEENFEALKEALNQ